MFPLVLLAFLRVQEAGNRFSNKFPTRFGVREAAQAEKICSALRMSKRQSVYTGKLQAHIIMAMGESERGLIRERGYVCRVVGRCAVWFRFRWWTLGGPGRYIHRVDCERTHLTPLTVLARQGGLVGPSFWHAVVCVLHQFHPHSPCRRNTSPSGGHEGSPS